MRVRSLTDARPKPKARHRTNDAGAFLDANLGRLKKYNAAES